MSNHNPITVATTSGANFETRRKNAVLISVVCFVNKFDSSFCSLKYDLLDRKNYCNILNYAHT